MVLTIYDASGTKAAPLSCEWGLINSSGLSDEPHFSHWSP